jgi:hypothetical protein
MRLGEALLGTCAALLVSAHGVAYAEDGAPPPTPSAEPPLPPLSDARPPVPPAPEQPPIPWHNHIEVGTGLAVAELPAHLDGAGNSTNIRFRPAPGFHVDLSWQLLDYLRVTGYLSEHSHALDLPPGSLGLAGTLSGPNAQMYSFGVRGSPTLPLGKRTRLWLTVGIGWGHIAYGRYTVTQAGMAPYTIRERDEDLFEVPLGFGGSFEIIPRWLSLRIELTGSFVPSQVGSALETGQAINAGAMQNFAPMPKLDAYFVQTIGLSLHL